MAQKKTGRERKSIDGIIMGNRLSEQDMKRVRVGVAKSNGMKKIASGLTVAPSNYYNPLYTPTSLQLPRDRKQINAWCRHYYETEAIPAAVIDLYAALPITDFSIECPNPYYRKFVEDMLKRLKIRDVLKGIALEYFKIGDVFIMAELDDQLDTWKRLTVLDPDYVEVQSSPLMDTPIIEMIPNEQVKRIVFDRQPREMYEHIRTFLPDIIRAINQQKNIPLDASHITHLKHMPTPYGTYGVPLMKRIFKTLMYKEMLRRAQFTIAERYVMPLKIFKLGTMEEPPTQEEIDDVQNQLTTVMADPTMVMITSMRFQADWQGIAGKTLQLASEYDFVEREMISGLGVSRAFIDGSGPTYANASIGGNAFLQKLENFRQTLKEWIEEKIIKPIAELQQWYDKDPDTDEEYLVVPEFKWDAMRLQDELTRQQMFMQLHAANALSAKTLLDSVHVNAETEAKLIEDERDTIFDPVRAMARQQAITMQLQQNMERNLLKMQMEMGGGAAPGGGAGDSGGGGGELINPLDSKSAPPLPMPSTDALSPGKSFSGISPGQGQEVRFAPLDKVTSRPPVAAQLRDMLRKVDAILAEDDENGSTKEG